ncbi:MAG: tetratricopeptide repeat protein [Nitrospiria bacterium]
MFFLFLFFFPVTASGDEAADKAYDLNRRAMIDMSEAKFEEAADLFQEAAKLKSDYEISGKPLLYTPTFMTAWAYEKIGDRKKACDEFSLFLKRAGVLVEPTKKEHADDFIKKHCL